MLQATYHVKRGATKRVCQIGRAHVASKAKVGDFEGSCMDIIACQEEILRLEISMYQVVCSQAFQSRSWSQR